ncbi:MAG: hypothetical protein HYY84_04035 [Deltaproteobacteria bacterium]|nr:hypothetical protein [Deltaproteobacteria bacterium]
MNRVVFWVGLIGLACGKATTASDAGTTGGVDADAGCVAPRGDAGVCPTEAGNCMGIGHPCTPGGGQCNVYTGTSCDKDLSVDGVGMCVKVFACTPGQKQCGNGASCCQTPMTQNVAVCLPNQCVPSDCMAEVW